MNLKVTVKYFGSVKDESGTEQENLELEPGITVADAISSVKKRHEALRGRKGQILFALNQNYTSDDAILKDGDELALFPVVSGG